MLATDDLTFDTDPPQAIDVPTRAGDETASRLPAEGSRAEETTALLAWIGLHPAHPDIDRMRERLVVINVPVAHAVAGRYRGRGIDIEDLRQVACLALLRASRSFDPHRGQDFLGYAVPCIRGEVKRHFRDTGWTIRPPRRIQELQAQINARGGDLLETTRPRVVELAAMTDSSPADVSEALEARGCFTPTSLDRPLGPDTSLTLASHLMTTDDLAYEEVDARLTVRPATAQLEPRDQEIIRLRYVEGWTQREIGDRLGMTQVSVSRLLTRIHSELRTILHEIDVAATQLDPTGT